VFLLCLKTRLCQSCRLFIYCLFICLFVSRITEKVKSGFGRNLYGFDPVYSWLDFGKNSAVTWQIMRKSSFTWHYIRSQHRYHMHAARVDFYQKYLILSEFAMLWCWVFQFFYLCIKWHFFLLFFVYFVYDFIINNYIGGGLCCPSALLVQFCVAVLVFLLVSAAILLALLFYVISGWKMSWYSTSGKLVFVCSKTSTLFTFYECWEFIRVHVSLHF